MNNPLVPTSMYDNALRLTTVEDRAPRNGGSSVVEFVGLSNDTVADAVRRALTDASQSLRTLEGAGVLVIPQIHRDDAFPRYRVTLRVTVGASRAGVTSPASA